MTDPRTQLVARGYDAIGDRFVKWRDQIVGDPRRDWERELVSRLLEGARVLELGRGAVCLKQSALPVISGSPEWTSRPRRCVARAQRFRKPTSSKPTRRARTRACIVRRSRLVLRVQPRAT